MSLRSQATGSSPQPDTDDKEDNKNTSSQSVLSVAEIDEADEPPISDGEGLGDDAGGQGPRDEGEADDGENEDEDEERADLNGGGMSTKMEQGKDRWTNRRRDQSRSENEEG